MIQPVGWVKYCRWFEGCFVNLLFNRYEIVTPVGVVS
jgi:hypothetical protein